MGQRFGTKAENLAWVAASLTQAQVLPQYALGVTDWRDARSRCLGGITALPWGDGPLAVRSSAYGEDSLQASQAGRFTSLLDVCGRAALEEAIDTVIASFGEAGVNDQVLVQPMLQNVVLSGVAFSCNPTSGTPYVIINAAEGGDTAAVTSGRESELITFVTWKNRPNQTDDPRYGRVVSLLQELESITGFCRLDIEFAFDSGDRLHLLQVRPLVVSQDYGNLALAAHHLESIAEKIQRGMQPHPYLHGRRTVYGVMPDWNPAEIIGVRPRPLALSLYSEMVTDTVWAYQRNNYGYKNLRSFPLMVNFHGQPYIDVRVSFNSFLPRDLDSDLSDRLVNHYIDRLLAAPTLHDKVEFGIIYSCYTLDVDERLQPLQDCGFTERDLDSLKHHLRDLTNRIIHGETGLWRTDTAKIEILQGRRQEIVDSNLDPVSKIYWLLEDCKRYGTLPFAGLARAGFIAIQLLRSLVNVGVLSNQEYDDFMGSLDTVSTALARDLLHLGQESFMAKYGHLRPGTYDILSPRYDEAPERYFDWDCPPVHDVVGSPRFALTLAQMKLIGELLRLHGFEHDVVGLLEFIKGGIEGREYAKFVFTRSMSDALSLFKNFGQELGFSAEDLSFANIGTIRALYTGSGDPRELLQASIDQGRQCFRLTEQVMLPPLITTPEDVWSFFVPPSEPNFITLRSAAGPVRDYRDQSRLEGAIVMIPSADPGFDWIFSRGIAGFITAYGGANSHMAIRAGELGLPAVIGAGETLFNRWCSAGRLFIDAANHQVKVLQ